MRPHDLQSNLSGLHFDWCARHASILATIAAQEIRGAPSRVAEKWVARMTATVTGRWSRE
jgi:hypothetical protein